jgi:CDP-4-dehydro-6-deoxyglucose reductase, E1
VPSKSYLNTVTHLNETGIPSSLRSQTCIKLHEPTFDEEEVAAAVAVLRSKNVTQGEKVKEFEKAFWPTGHAVACNSGSSANLLAISALKASGRLKDGDEVIVSALSWSTTVFPIIQHNLIPVIVDCDPDTLNMDMEQAEMAISPKTKAIMPVHVYGNPCDMDILYVLCRDHGLVMIEDCCESMGAEYNGVPVGHWADVATFSFYFSHHITTLEGGMVVTKDHDTADMLRIQRSHGWLRDSDREVPDGMDRKFCFVELGYNFRLTEVQAAIGLCQLPKLDDIIARRRAAHSAYVNALSHIQYLRFQKDNGKSSCFGFSIVLDGAPFTVTELRQYLESRGIETRPIICGNIARQPVMEKYEHRVFGDLRNATDVMVNGFSVGVHQDVTQSDVDYVAESMNEFVK